MKSLKTRLSIIAFISLKGILLFLSVVFCVIFPTIAVPIVADEEFNLEKEIAISSDLFETLNRLKSNPVNINSATYEELLEIPYITPTLALRIENFRGAGNSFTNKRDLLKIAGFNKLLLEKISPFIVVRMEKKMTRKTGVRWKTVIEEKYPVNNDYNGSPLKIRSKIKYDNGWLKFGANTYKDAYESNYADFYTLYGYMKKGTYSMLAGDYAMDLGERLVLGYPGFVFKSSGLIKGKDNIERVYSSGFEDFSLRGGVLRKDWGKTTSAVFFSYKKIDATVEDGIVKRLRYQTAYHRNETEMAAKDRVREKVFGATLKGGNSTLIMGATSLYGVYDRTIEPDTETYYCFSGKKYGLSGLHFLYNKDRYSFWSEFAYSLYTKGTGFIAGGSFKPQKTTILLLFRDYSKSYYSPRAFAFCESEVRNERGFYTYVNSELRYGFYLSGYLDVYTRQSPTFFNLLPTNGYSGFLSLEKKIKKSSFYVRYRRREKNTFQWEDKSLRYKKDNLRFSLKTALNKKAYFKVLWEGDIFAVPEISLGEFGNLYSINFGSDVGNNTKVEIGLIFYETASYNSRIYFFLNDIPGSMYTKPFYGEGRNIYLLLRNRFISHLLLYGRLEMEISEQTENSFKIGMEWR
ncbi:MAG: hypothetical protein B5M53_01260 [Candidatus Cloacimonas sp. 4484_209]|nr:MAG: hypothetical protein B5M53_01260 [Candidatus Cloacimonas sp. 4484_209]